jgi:hypothetical protein
MSIFDGFKIYFKIIDHNTFVDLIKHLFYRLFFRRYVLSVFSCYFLKVMWVRWSDVLGHHNCLFWIHIKVLQSLILRNIFYKVKINLIFYISLDAIIQYLSIHKCVMCISVWWLRCWLTSSDPETKRHFKGLFT